MTDNMQRLSTTLKEDLETLSDLKKKATIKKKRTEKLAKKLDAQRSSLANLSKKRAALVNKTSKARKANSAEIARLAKKSKNLQELVAALKRKQAAKKLAKKKKHTKNSQAPKKVASSSKANSKLRSFRRAKSPAAGRIKTRYGQKNAQDEKSKGIVIATPAGASVSAPFDAEVVYTGRFRSFGRMVILRHKGGFHTLVAGLRNINTKQGEFLLEGEPIGAMGNSSDSRNLYVEVRKNNKPVNPTKWIYGI